MRKTVAVALALPLTALLVGRHTPAEARRVAPTPTPTHAPTTTPTPRPTVTAAPTQPPTLTAPPSGSATATGTAAVPTPVASATPSATPTAASSYNGAAAAAYADTYWSTYNPQWPSYATSGGDCTNFVSQSLDAGGIAMRPNPPYSGTAAWFMRGTPTNPNPSTSWINANDNSTFLGASLPATKVGTYTGLGPTVTQASGASQGDVISYDWNGDGVVDHQAVVVTSDGQSVDAHTNNRYHAYWTLAQYNAQWQTTIITVYHVTPGTK
jgi:hypothetical protein